MRLLPLARATALLCASIGAGLTARVVPAAEATDSIQAVAYNTVTVRPTSRVECDLAKLQARARVIWVSSGAIAFSVRAIDDDAKTVFRFSGSDLHPTLILELADSEPLDGVSALFDPEEGSKLEVFLTNQLPKQVDQSGVGQSLLCLTDPRNPNQSGAEFAATNARYVIFRWTRTKATKSPFGVAEVSVFSKVSSEHIQLPFAETEIHFTNESKVDFSNQLGTIADPPSIAVVSP